MDKLKIKLEQNQFIDICAVYFQCVMDIADKQTRGNLVLHKQTMRKLKSRIDRSEPLNGLVTYTYTYDAYVWELILLSIVQAKYKLSTYSQITVNTLLEKICT